MVSYLNCNSAFSFYHPTWQNKTDERGFLKLNKFSEKVCRDFFRFVVLHRGQNRMKQILRNDLFKERILMYRSTTPSQNFTNRFQRCNRNLLCEIFQEGNENWNWELGIFSTYGRCFVSFEDFRLYRSHLIFV